MSPFSDSLTAWTKELALAEALGNKLQVVAPDVRFKPQGRDMVLEPCSRKARKWVDRNVDTDDWQWVDGDNGPAFLVDDCCLDDILDAMEDSGLEIIPAGNPWRKA